MIETCLGKHRGAGGRVGAWVTGPDSLPLSLRPVVEGRARLTRSPWAGVRQGRTEVRVEAGLNFWFLM